MSDNRFVQQFDAEPQFWQFLKGLRSDDLIVELIQNDLDANASRTSITFTPDHLICHGNGETVSEDGWRRLSFVMGAGVQVESKQFRIGVKNHGLKACFWLGDEIIVRSDGLRMIQTLYKDGYENPASPGTLAKPVPDNEAPPTGCSIEVPYRKRELVVAKGEAITIGVPDGSTLEELFRNACELLPGRLLGVVRPGVRDQYTLRLSHHALGFVEIHWRAKRGRNINGRGRRQFTVFGRECNTSSKASRVLSSTIHEQACTFRLPFPVGKRAEVPDFFARDGKSFMAEIAWLTDKRGTPRSTKGVRRYPIGYDATSESALSGVGVHFSGPYISDAERHGTSQMVSLNDYIDDACKGALVDIMASYLLHRHGGRAMELYMVDPSDPEFEPLNDLVERSLDRRALPLAHKAIRVSKRSKRLTLGPRKTSTGTVRRIVLPMFTWDQDRISSQLSEICPRVEDQVDKTVPGPILRCLAGKPDVVTFDENDAVERLQPKQKTKRFPWKTQSEWQATLGNSSVAKVYLDVMYETVQRRRLASESLVIDNTYLPDENCSARPLVQMFSAVNLPPNLGQREHVPILHSELHGHRLLKRKAWKPKPFTLDDYLDDAQLETASLAKRKSFWTWLRNNWRIVKNRQTLVRTADLPVWPSSCGQFLPLEGMCHPRNSRVASIMGDAIIRPSAEILRTGIVSTNSRGRLTFRNMLSYQEIKEFLSERINRFPRERQLTPTERREFHKLEKDLTSLATSNKRLGSYLRVLAEESGLALDKDGNLRDPGELLRQDATLRRLHLLNRHIIDRPNSILDRINGWKPLTAPSTHQIIDTLRKDGARLDAHVPRLQEYVRQSKREDIDPVDLLAVPCIPVEGQLHSPNQIALRRSRNFWGDWKIHVPVTDINPETQRLYRLVGVVGGTPNPTNSRKFFRWLASQDADVVVRHTDQVLRHINHKFGPRAWSREFPRVPFIMVEQDGGRIRLVTWADATKSRSKVVIPDFEELEEAIRQHKGRRPVEMAIVASQRVTEPITARLREFDLRTLSDFAGEPVKAVGTGKDKPSRNFDFKRILDSLQSGLKGKQLQKRLAKLDLDTPQSALRNNWRERLANVQDIRTAESVIAFYKLGRNIFSVPVLGKLDKESGTLWIRPDCELRTVFFDVIADHVFERPKRYYGSVLDLAYKMDMRERYPLEYSDGVQSPEDIEIGEKNNQDGVDSSPSETPAIHPVPKSDPSKNVPNPGPIPQGDGVIRRFSKERREGSRSQSAFENSQIDNLKENQYAWHCQACIAGTEPQTLAPQASYVEVPENRRTIMHAHHCDHVSAGGARHAGNILLLCRYHHLDLGDAVTRTEVTRAFDQAGKRRLTFDSANGVSSNLEGKVITIDPSQRQDPISLFFTQEHADYWLTKANEEGLV